MGDKEKIKIEEDGIVKVYDIEKDEETPEELKESILDSGGYVLWYSIIQVVLLPIYYFFTSDTFILSSLAITLFFTPLIICGIKINRNDFSNLKKLKRLIVFCIVYCLLIVFISMTQGGEPTLLSVFSLFSLFKAKSKLKKLMRNGL